MAQDVKKSQKELYVPSKKPGIIEVPDMNYVAVRGEGDPNVEGGAYKTAVGKLYAFIYTIRMSKRAGHDLSGFEEFVVPPLEGFWWQAGIKGVDLSRKDSFQWISCIRLPDFVTPEIFEWAQAEVARKKDLDVSDLEFLQMNEGLCVQILHLGPYDNERKSVEKMERFVEDEGLCFDFSETRRHHEIYLSDPRKTAAEKLKTVIRHPVKRI